MNFRIWSRISKEQSIICVEVCMKKEDSLFQLDQLHLIILVAGKNYKTIPKATFWFAKINIPFF